jgi:hypothetical protein
VLCEREVVSYQKAIRSVERNMATMDKIRGHLFHKMYDALSGEYEEMQHKLEEKRNHIWQQLEAYQKDRQTIKMQVAEIAGEDRKLSVVKTLDYLINLEKLELTQGKAKATKVRNKPPQKHPQT